LVNLFELYDDARTCQPQIYSELKCLSATLLLMSEKGDIFLACFVVVLPDSRPAVWWTSLCVMSNHSTETTEIFPLYNIKMQIKNFMDSKILPRQ